MQQQCFDKTVTTHYEEVNVLTIFFSFTEEIQESQKMLNTAIHPQGFPSPALDRLCPPFLDKGELHWWLLHELHLCHLQRQR